MQGIVSKKQPTYKPTKTGLPSLQSSAGLDDLAEMKYEELSINGLNADRDRILEMPICRLVAMRSGTSSELLISGSEN